MWLWKNNFHSPFETELDFRKSQPFSCLYHMLSQSSIDPDLFQFLYRVRLIFLTKLPAVSLSLSHVFAENGFLIFRCSLPFWAFSWGALEKKTENMNFIRKTGGKKWNVVGIS